MWHVAEEIEECTIETLWIPNTIQWHQKNCKENGTIEESLRDSGVLNDKQLHSLRDTLRKEGIGNVLKWQNGTFEFTPNQPENAQRSVWHTCFTGGDKVC